MPVYVGTPARSRIITAPTAVLCLLCLLYLILFMDRVNISAVATLIKADLKLSNSRMGLVFSAFAVPYAVFQLIGGWVGDRLGPRLALSLCCVVVSLTTVLTGLAGGFGSLFALRLALGFGEGAAFPPPRVPCRDGRLRGAGDSHKASLTRSRASGTPSRHR